MSTIDEIMEAVESVKTAAAEHQRWPSAMRRIILGKETDGLSACCCGARPRWQWLVVGR